MAELQYPNQNNIEKTMGFMQSGQKARIKYIVKKGIQHNMNPPTMIPNVLAAFVSIRKRFT